MAASQCKLASGVVGGALIYGGFSWLRNLTYDFKVAFDVALLHKYLHHNLDSILRLGDDEFLARARKLRVAVKGHSLPSPQLLALLELFEFVRLFQLHIMSKMPDNVYLAFWRKLCADQGAIRQTYPKTYHVEGDDTCPLKGSLWVHALCEQPAVPDPPACVLFVHGGGFSGGRASTYISFCSELSRRLGCCPVLSAEYLLTPEHAGIQDQVTSILNVYKWLVSHKKYPRHRIILCGDSAGGGLVALLLQSLGEQQPAAAVLVSPWLDLELTGASYKTNIGRNPALTITMLHMLRRVLQQRSEHQGKLGLSSHSALNGDWRGLAPLYFWAAEAEMLRDDSVQAAAKAQAASVEVVLDIESWCFHETPMWCMSCPEGMAALDRIAAFCQRALSSPKHLRSKL